ncbi:MAG: diguanylate cyclase [Pseudomonadota bacterium]
MRFSISRTLLAIFIIVGVISGVAITLVGDWVQSRSVSSLAEAESRRSAELVFQNLYSVMRKGWTRDEIAELVDRVNRTNPDLDIRVYRSEQVAAMFGEVEADRMARSRDPLVAEAMAGRGERLTVEDDRLRFLYPIFVTEECLACHVGAEVGSVNGVIDIRQPLHKLRVPLEFTLNSVVAVFAVLVALLFVVTLVSVRFLIVRPMAGLADHIDGIMRSGDLGRRLDGRGFRWLDEVRSLADNFNRLMAELEASRSRLVEQSVTDALTGLGNRRHFTEILETEHERARRYGHAMAVLMVDLDGFKPINDRWGHAIGDVMLRRVAEAMARQVRTNDKLARLGGDEFAVLAPETGRAGAAALAAKLVAAIESVCVDVGDQVVSVGASVGIGVYPVDGQGADEVVHAADSAMYADKRRRKAAPARPG